MSRPAPDFDRLAVVDIGSNSVRLLIADVACGQIVPIETDRATTRLLSGMRDGYLDEAAIARTAQAVDRFARAGRAAGASLVCAFGTSAMRDGRNGKALLDAIRAMGVEARILSGEEEAELAYLSAAGAGRVGVLDIGGGSTECIVGTDGRVQAAASAQMGAVRLAERLRGCLEPTTLVAAAREELAAAAGAVLARPVERWVGQGGSVTTLAAIELRLSVYESRLVENYALTAEATEALLKMLCGLSLEERRCLPGLQPARADIIPYGAAILAAFFDISKAKTVFVSDRDNLYGFIKKNFSKGVDKR